MHTIGTRLKEERERLGMTQPAFAEAAVGAKKRTLIDWEKDVSSPTALQLSALAAIGVDVLYVLTNQRINAMPAADAAEQLLLESYRRCSGNARQNLIQTAALLAAGLQEQQVSGTIKQRAKSGAVQVGGAVTNSPITTGENAHGVRRTARAAKGKGQ